MRSKDQGKINYCACDNYLSLWNDVVFSETARKTELNTNTSVQRVSKQDIAEPVTGTVQKLADCEPSAADFGG